MTDSIEYPIFTMGEELLTELIDWVIDNARTESDYDAYEFEFECLDDSRLRRVYSSLTLYDNSGNIVCQWVYPHAREQAEEDYENMILDDREPRVHDRH